MNRSSDGSRAARRRAAAAVSKGDRPALGLRGPLRRPSAGFRLALAFGLALLLLASALGTLAIPYPVSAQDGRRHVDDDPGCEGQSPCYPSIQAAVDAALDGETIAVAAGTYSETVRVVDKALSFEGPGVDLEAPDDDPSRQAIWRGLDGGTPGRALTIDARTRDLADLRVEGFRFEAGSGGVLLHARLPGDPLGLVPGLPATVVTVPTHLGRVEILGNHFVDLGGGSAGEPAAVLAMLASETRIVANLIQDVDAGLLIRAGRGLTIEGNRIERAAGPGIEVLGLAGQVEIHDNTIVAPAGRGIEIDGPLAGVGASLETALDLRGNRVEQAGAEALRLQAGAGQSMTPVKLVGNSLIDAGRSALALDGALAILADGGALRGLEIAGGEIRGLSVPGAAGLHIAGVTSTVDIAGLSVTEGSGPGIRLVDARSFWLRRSTITGNAEALRVVETSASDPARAFDLRVGGFASEGNRLADNGMGLVLETSGASGASHDVDARYNNWGVAWAPEIERLIEHQPDDGRLGRVSYLPALGTPATILVDASPPLLEADGQSTSRITARVLDAAGQPAADGALVTFGTNGGRIERPGLQAEAEDPAVVPRDGRWSVLDDARYGLASSLGYLRAASAGAVLSWTFDAPAIVLRYGQSPVDPGRFRVHLDGLLVADISAQGPRREWVEQPLAASLGSGPHDLRIEALGGEVAIDRLVAGERLVDGKAASTLQSAGVPGRARVGVEAYGAGGMIGGGIEVPFVSGPPASMTLAVESDTLPVGGATTRVVASLRDQAGRPVRDGSPLRFGAQGGTIDPMASTTRSGQAEAVFSSGERVGPAFVIAAIEGLTVTRGLTLVAGAPAALVVTPTRATLPANSRASTALVIEVRDAYGNRVADGTTVRLSTSLGRLQDDRVATLDGRAETSLVAGNEAGVAVIRAVAGSGEGTAMLNLLPTDLGLVKLAEPRSVVVPGETVTFTLRIENQGEGIVYDVDLVDRLPAGLISPTFRSDFQPRGPMLENRSGSDPYVFRIDRMSPGQLGLITITARLDTSLSWGGQSSLLNRASVGSLSAAELAPEDNQSSAAVEVSPGAAFTVTVEAPERLKVGGERAEVRVRVLDRRGNPAADGTAVFLTTDAPGIARIAPSVATTRGGLALSSLVTGQESGETVIRAISLDERGGSARLRVLPGPPEQIRLARGRDSIQIGGQSAALTATLSDRFGNGVPEAAIRFVTDAGLLTQTQARTDASGVATSSLRSGIRVGRASVRASHLELVDETAIVFRPGDPSTLMLELADRRIVVGGQTLAVARVEDAFGNPVPGVPVEFDTDIGRLARRLDITDGEGRAETGLGAPRPGSGMVSARSADLQAEKRLVVDPARAWLPFLSRR